MRMSMISKAFVAGLVAASAVGGARAEDHEDAVSTARDEAQAAKPPKRGPFIKQSKACGTAADFFFCAATTKDTVGNLYLAPYSVKFVEKGTAAVTWKGSVYCEVNSQNSTVVGSAKRSYVSYFTHLGLVTSTTEDFTLNSTGAISVGEALDTFFISPTINQETSFRRIALTPVTLTKVYNVKKAKTVDFRVAVKPDFRQFKFEPYCNINGGTTTVQFQPG